MLYRNPISDGSKRGSSLIEMSCALTLIIPAFLLLIDLYFLIMGYWWTASLCNTAARTASQGPPNALMPKSADIRVKEVLNSGTESTNTTARIVNYEVTERITRLPLPRFGGAVSGCVTVDVDSAVSPPFCLKYLLPDRRIILHMSKSCPYTYVLPAIARDAQPPSQSLN
jgi:hypothetical protein